MAKAKSLFRQALITGACFFLIQGDVLSQVPELKIIEKPIRGGFKPASNRKIKAIIVHATFNKSTKDSFSVEGCIRQFERYGVSAHYILDRSGRVYELVPTDFISFQAGKSSLPDGETAVNSTSIGIEVISAQGAGPTQAQYQSLAALADRLKVKYPETKYLLGHSHIAPHRKTDPWDFDWSYFKSLVKSNFIWPNP